MTEELANAIAHMPKGTLIPVDAEGMPKPEEYPRCYPVEPEPTPGGPMNVRIHSLRRVQFRVQGQMPTNLLYDKPDIIAELRRRIDAEGSQKAVAKLMGFSPQFIGDVLKGRRAVTTALAGALGFKRVDVWVKVNTGEEG